MGMEDRHVLEGHREIGPACTVSKYANNMLTSVEESGDGGGCDEKPGQAMAS